MKHTLEGILGGALLAILMFILAIVYGARTEDMKLIQDSIIMIGGFSFLAICTALCLYKPKKTLA